MKKLALILLASLCLSGCGRLQLEDRLLAVSMGLERLPEGELQLTVQVPTASQGGGSGGQEGGDAGGTGGYMVMSVSGQDWEGAMDALEKESPHLLNFSQLRQVVVNEQLAASEDFLPLLKQVFRRHQVRSNAYVIIIPGECKAFLEKQKPDVGGHLGKYLDTVMKNLVAKQYVPQAVLGLVVRDLDSRMMDPPLIWGELKEDKVQFLGSALTSRGRVTGKLNGHETQLLALLNGGGKRVNIRTEEGKNAEVSAFRGADAQIEPEGRLTVSLHVTAYTPVVDSPSQQALEEALKKELEELIAKLQAAQSDAAGFNRQALWGTATLAEAEQKVWRFEQAQVTVQVDAQMVISSS